MSREPIFEFLQYKEKRNTGYVISIVPLPTASIELFCVNECEASETEKDIVQAQPRLLKPCGVVVGWKCHAWK